MSCFGFVELGDGNIKGLVSRRGNRGWGFRTLPSFLFLFHFDSGLFRIKNNIPKTL